MTRRRLFGFIAVIQSVLCLTHLLLYETWTFSPAVRRYLRGALDQTGAWLLVDELCRRFATRISLYECCSARVLQDCRGLGGVAELSLSCCGLLVDYFWNYATGGLDVNFHRTVELLYGAAVVTGLYWGFQCQLDAHHASDCAACEPASGVARAKSGPNQ